MEKKLKSKKELRNEILRLRDALSEEERNEKSHHIAEKVIAQKEFTEADKVLLFASFKSEVGTQEIFEAARTAGKSVYYPKILGKEMEFFLVEKAEDLSEEYWGIREPEAILERKFFANPEEKICVIMPGAVFDVEGNRIGYGGGYYDKFLQKLEIEFSTQQREVYKIAVAFECQMTELGNIISETYDIKPNCIITEKRKLLIIAC